MRPSRAAVTSVSPSLMAERRHCTDDAALTSLLHRSVIACKTLAIGPVLFLLEVRET